MTFWAVAPARHEGEVFQVTDFREPDGSAADLSALQGFGDYTGARRLYCEPLGGTVHDWNWWPLCIPFLRTSVATRVRDIAPEAVDLLPLEIAGLRDSFSVILIRARECVDEERSIFRRWTHADSVRPEAVGKYRTLDRLVIDEDRVKGAHLFRVAGYEVSLIASEYFLKTAKRAGWTGLDFLPADAFDDNPTALARLRPSELA